MQGWKSSVCITEMLNGSQMREQNPTKRRFPLTVGFGENYDQRQSCSKG
jgi:hypothetical protein